MTNGENDLKHYYSKTCLKPTPAGPNNLSALDRCPLYGGSLILAEYDKD